MGPICFSDWVYGMRSKKYAYRHALAKSGHAISTGSLRNNNQVKVDLILRISSGDLL